MGQRCVAKGGEYELLIRAAHVLEDEGKSIDPEEIGIMIGNIFHILNGSIKYSAKGIHPNNEKVDLIIWHLEDPNVIRDLEQKYRFLSIVQLDVEHNVTTKSNYLVVGFPVSKTRKKVDTMKITVAPFIFLTNLAEVKVYERLKLEGHSHLVVQYRKRKIKDFKRGFVMGPDPNGISGSGLWYFPTLNRNDAGEIAAKLVGIMHEWRKEDAVMIATRIHIVTETIRESFNLNLAKSTITKVNVS